MLTKEQILGALDLRTETVEVPEWNGAVLVRGLTARQRDNFEMAVTRNGKISVENIRARLVAASVVGEDGKRLFQDSDVDALGEKSGMALTRLFAVAQRLSGMTQADVEELAKNSESTRDGASG